MRLVSRASALARLQTALVERALRQSHPRLDVECLTRSSAGDQDQASPLWKLPDKGAFTADLSRTLLDGGADIAVHSYKDLPTEMPIGTRIAGALPRADARDVLLMRLDAVASRPSALRILSSSPRRAWLLADVLPALMPWPVTNVSAVPVRGNVETRLRKLHGGEDHGLVIAKAALDRLLGYGPPFEQEAHAIRSSLDRCRWMVLPMREFPWAPAQGAVALETPVGRPDLDELLAPVICERTSACVGQERDVLGRFGGGCHQALGVAVVDKSYGRVVSIRGREVGDPTWRLDHNGTPFPRAAADRVWPRRGETVEATRQPLGVPQPTADGFWVSRADALPDSWTLPDGAFVWTAGSVTWRRLAARGVWVNGCADGLGDDQAPAVDLLAGRRVQWTRLTHDRAAWPDALATYHVEAPLPDDLESRTHFYWMSGELFLRAIERWPSLRHAWHASGPGRTQQTIVSAVGATERTGIWLDRDSWEQDVCQ